MVANISVAVTVTVVAFPLALLAFAVGVGEIPWFSSIWMSGLITMTAPMRQPTMVVTTEYTVHLRRGAVVRLDDGLWTWFIDSNGELR